MTDQSIQFFGAPWCPDCQRSKKFLNEQRVPYQWHDIDQDETARAYVQEVNRGKQIIPTIVFPDGSILVEPTDAELANKLGIHQESKLRYYDLVIVGAGPAGLTAGLYAAREGISTLLIEQSGVGGQAATTQEIDNYPGFPESISGAELADRLKRQVERFGVELLAAQEVSSLKPEKDHVDVSVKSGQEFCPASIILATGSTYSRLGVPGEEAFFGAGVHFCATCDGPFYKGQDIVVIGGGNSAFQEGLFLTKFAKSVTIMMRGKEPKASQALIQKVAERKDMQVLSETTVDEFRGAKRLESIVVRHIATGDTREMRPGAVFQFIGLKPNTDFLRDTVELDKVGFVMTKPNLETSLAGVFAAGDCRSGSTKQVASAVGEGATAALMVREYLERTGMKGRAPVEELAAS
ncbi:MAG: FAD-dependent oxidoreductase [Dehalococcoidia bacterium]|nr:FAD-dependent oxidoreductase [Dehalococcoidia bacterium]